MKTKLLQLAVLAQHNACRCAVAVGLLAVAPLSQATMDVSAVTDKMTEVTVGIAAVGAAYLVMMVGAKAFKWITRAF